MVGLVVLLILAVIIGAICGVVALVKLSDMQARLKLLEIKLTQSRPSPSEAVAATPQPLVSEPLPNQAEPIDTIVPVTTLWHQQQQDVEQFGFETSDNNHSVASKRSEKPGSAIQQGLNWLEQQLIERGMVWLGGVALALGGVFLVRFSLEAGWFTPTLRIVSGVVFAGILLATSEYLHYKKWVKQSLENYIPAALASAGFITLYAAILMALQWYQLLDAHSAFGLLALVALAASWFSLRQGPILAVIGIVGAYLVPVLVNTEQADLLGLLVYLAAITLSSVLVEQRVKRPWLWFLPIMGLSAWLLIIVLSVAPSDTLLVLAALAITFITLVWLPPLHYRPAWYGWQRYPTVSLQQWLPLPREQWLGLVVVALMLLLSWQPQIVIPFSAMLMVFMVFWLAALTCPRGEIWLYALIILLLNWVGQSITPFPPTPLWYSGIVLDWQLMAGLCVIAAIPVLLLAPQRMHWAVFLALAPLLILVISHQHLLRIALVAEVKTLWVLYGALLVAVQAWLAQRSKLPAQAFIHSAGANLAISWCLTLYLSVAALTLALAMQLVLITLLSVKRRFPLPHWVIKALVAVILVRLTSAPLLGSYEEVTFGGWHWSMVIYPLVIMCFSLGSFLWQNTALAPWLVGATLQLLVVFLTVQGQYWLQGQQLDFKQQDFYTLSFHAASWMMLAVSYHYRSYQAQTMQRLYRYACMLLLCFAALAQLILHLRFNPFFTEQLVGSWPVLNWLAVLWFIPAMCLFLLARMRAPNRYQPVGYYLASGLLLLFILGSIRQFWQGTQISVFLSTSNAEHYTYSLIFMVVAVLMIMIAQQWFGAALRKAGFALLSLVILKVFIFDLNQLTGLLRAASFIGLGLSLVLLSALFQQLKKPRA